MRHPPIFRNYFAAHRAIGIPLAEVFTDGRRRLELSAQLGDALDGLVEHLQRACRAIARKMLMVTHSSRARLLNDSM